jgi:hypothetical protein
MRLAVHTMGRVRIPDNGEALKFLNKVGLGTVSTADTLPALSLAAQ